jgi:hypothetical protein
MSVIFDRGIDGSGMMVREIVMTEDGKQMPMLYISNKQYNNPKVKKE